MKRIFLYIGILTIGFACKEEDVTPFSSNFVDDFYSQTTSLELVVAYEEDAEPYINFNTQSAWDITDDNINDLLSGKGISIVVPKALNEMEFIGNLQQESFTNEELQNLADDFISTSKQGDAKKLILLFLDGFLNEDGEKQEQVVGLNFSGTPIVAIFKPVIESASPSSGARTLIEQATVCHEVGHALGLVDNGVALQSDHKDEANGAHCSNDDCVMYYQNSGGSASGFIQPFLTGGDIDLFGQECLNDVQAK